MYVRDKRYLSIARARNCKPSFGDTCIFSPALIRLHNIGGTAGIFNWLFAIPIDTMKSRLQVKIS